MFRGVASLARNAHVAVGISGGVDSSSVVCLLKRQGFRVTAVFMNNWDSEEEGAEMCRNAQQDFSDSQEVCSQLGVPLRTVSFSREYWCEVFEDTVRAYERGLTPNPDIVCNAAIKFRYFRDYCLSRLGADYVATGHYARIAARGEENALLRGVDRENDQSYFLSTVTSAQLGRVLFPLGGVVKSEVRKFAEENGLHVSAKKTSAGLCFVGKRKFKDFISEYIPARPGKFCDIQGKELPHHSHNGIHLYTLGQCARLPGSEEKMYVLAKDSSRNLITVGKEIDLSTLDIKHCVLKDFVAVRSPPSDSFSEEWPFLCILRFRSPPIECRIQWRGTELHVYLKEAFRALACGQYVAIYDKTSDECFGAGVVAASETD